MNIRTESLVSVIVCNYNYEGYISEAIQSVLNQTYQNIQVIVVDDGSMDSSREVLETFSDSRLKVIYQANAGQAAAFNTAFNACSGEFVAFLDSDDFWYEKKLEISVPEFGKGNISAVQHNLHLVDENSKLLSGLMPDLSPGRHSIQSSYFKHNHTGFFSPTSGIVCRKEDLERIFPLDSSWNICADVAFTRPLPIFGDIVMLDKILGAYRVHGDNNWYDSIDSHQLVENQIHYVNYTNECLARFGIDKKLEFENSFRYHLCNAKSGQPSPLWMRAYLLLKKTGRKIPFARGVYRRLFGRHLEDYRSI